MKILITGFEPFGEQKTNPSERLAVTLAKTYIRGAEICAVVLPVDTQRGPRILLEEIQRVKPEAVLCVGQAGRRMRISIERVAVNLLDFEIADNGGNKIEDQPVIPGGPAAYFSTLPVRRLYNAVREAGVPVELSMTAGAYLCNQVMYVLLHHVHTQGPLIPAGFIHLPFLPEQAASLPGPASASMSLETMQDGLEAVIKELVKG